MNTVSVHAIRLPAKGGGSRGLALVDNEDVPNLSAYRWYLGSDGYARRFETVMGVRRSVAMHRQILDLAPGDIREGDHINGLRLDCRRANLRVVSHAENTQNVRHKVGRSGHRNVYFHPRSGLWRVQLRASGRLVSGGYFHSLDDAVATAGRLRRDLLPFAVDA